MRAMNPWFKKLNDLKRWRYTLLNAGAGHSNAGDSPPLRSPTLMSRHEELFEVDREISVILNSGFVDNATIR